MKILKVKDYEMPALVNHRLGYNCTNKFNIKGWEPVLLGSRLKAPAYYHRAEPGDEYPEPEIQDVQYDCVVQYRYEYHGYILSVDILSDPFEI